MVNKDRKFPNPNSFDDRTYYTIHEGTLSEYVDQLKDPNLFCFLSGNQVSLKRENRKINPFCEILENYEIESRLGINSFEAGLWWSRKDTVTWLHYDRYLCPNIMLQIKGKKKFTFIPPENHPDIYLVSDDINRPFFNFSRVDFTAPNLELFPKWRNTNPIELTLEPGDLLFIPKFWVHGVKHLEAINISINFWYR